MPRPPATRPPATRPPATRPPATRPPGTSSWRDPRCGAHAWALSEPLLEETTKEEHGSIVGALEEARLFYFGQRDQRQF